jgi:hypothetical protein
LDKCWKLYSDYPFSPYRTITQNGAAVCPTCHAIIHHKEKLNEQQKGEKGLEDEEDG